MKGWKDCLLIRRANKLHILFGSLIILFMSRVKFIPGFLKFWFVLSAFIVFFDASFVLQRPATLKGGDLYKYYFPYDNYVIYDTLYADLKDSFVVIQSWLNIVEGVFLIVAVILSLSRSLKASLWGAAIGTIASTCVFWKTVIFVWYDHDWSTEAAKNFTPGSILCYWFPNSLWLVFPLLAMFLIPQRIINYVSQEITPKPKSEWEAVWFEYALFIKINIKLFDW